MNIENKVDKYLGVNEKKNFSPAGFSDVMADIAYEISEQVDKFTDKLWSFDKYYDTKGLKKSTKLLDKINDCAQNIINISIKIEKEAVLKEK